MGTLKLPLSKEIFSGLLLGIAALLAIIVENSPLNYLYDQILQVALIIQIGDWSINKPILLWINDGLMAIFFLLVTLEIKREVVAGELSSIRKITLPGVAAVGGILFPALCYTFVNYGDSYAMRGWAIPAATDIAFALGFISLLGSRIPKQLKLCLVTIAILDDIAAIAIIAIFYTSDLSLVSLACASAGVIALIILNRKDVQSLAFYGVIGLFVWVCVLKSGVHATLAGVLLGCAIPMKRLRQFEHDLAPCVNYIVLPIFAFANAGVPLASMSLNMIDNPITLGIMFGLSVGAPGGVITFSAAIVKLGITRLPNTVTWTQYIGMAMLTGIGFTMSLFIGTLAFADVATQNAVRVGVIFGSATSGIIGILLLFYSTRR